MVGTLTNQNPASSARKACKARIVHKACKAHMVRKVHKTCKACKAHMACKARKVVGKKSGFYVNEVVQFY